VTSRLGSGGSSSVRHDVAAGVYLLIARHLPWSPRPGGGVAKAARARLAAQMLDSCGVDVNIEHGAWFGSGRGVSVGDRSAIGLDALVIGPVTIGSDVMMGPRCVLLSSSHEFGSTDLPMNAQGFRDDRPIVIEDDVWIGAGTTILPGCRIGRGSIVGAASVVTSSVEPWSIVAGNPARLVRRRRDLTDSPGVAS
jgi:maltose O-acetyltransferase